MCVSFYYEARKGCVLCYTCVFDCPVGAVKMEPGVRAVIDRNKCIRCGKCMENCCAEAIVRVEEDDEEENKK